MRQRLLQETPLHCCQIEQRWPCWIHASHGMLQTRRIRFHWRDIKGRVHCWTALWTIQEGHPLPKETAVCSRMVYKHRSLTLAWWDCRLHCHGGFHDQGEVPGLSQTPSHKFFYPYQLHRTDPIYSYQNVLHIRVPWAFSSWTTLGPTTAMKSSNSVIGLVRPASIVCWHLLTMIHRCSDWVLTAVLTRSQPNWRGLFKDQAFHLSPQHILRSNTRGWNFVRLVGSHWDHHSLWCSGLFCKCWLLLARTLYLLLYFLLLYVPVSLCTWITPQTMLFSALNIHTESGSTRMRICAISHWQQDNKISTQRLSPTTAQQHPAVPQSRLARIPSPSSQWW